MSDYVLIHHGIKGQKWGIRRFQKKDGSLTAAGKKHYATEGYIEDIRNTKRGKVMAIYDEMTDSASVESRARKMYRKASKKERDERANEYVKHHPKIVQWDDAQITANRIDMAYKVTAAILGGALNSKYFHDLLKSSTSQQNLKRGKKVCDDTTARLGKMKYKMVDV